MAPIAELIGPNGDALVTKVFTGDVKVQHQDGAFTIETNTFEGALAIRSVDPEENGKLRITSDKNGVVFDGKFYTKSLEIPAEDPREVREPQEEVVS